MSFPNTKAVPANWSAHHRPVATGGMNATCTLHEPDGEPTYDPDDMTSTPTPGALLWTGLCRVQAQTSGEGTNDQAGQEVTVRGYLVQLDLTGAEVPDPAEHNVIRVTVCANDPQLVGRPLVVTDVLYGSEGFTRDVFVQDNLG